MYCWDASLFCLVYNKWIDTQFLEHLIGWQCNICSIITQFLSCILVRYAGLDLISFQNLCKNSTNAPDKVGVKSEWKIKQSVQAVLKYVSPYFFPCVWIFRHAINLIPFSQHCDNKCIFIHISYCSINWKYRQSPFFKTESRENSESYVWYCTCMKRTIYLYSHVP